MDKWIIPFTIDLFAGTHVVFSVPQGLMLPGDSEAHTIRVTALINRQPAQLSGEPYGFFTRADGRTVVCEGTMIDNIIARAVALCYPHAD